MSKMTLNEYQVEAAKTAIFPQEKALEYIALGLSSEAGELAGHYRLAKLAPFGEGYWVPFLSEAGDILWYASAMATHMKLPLQDFRDSAQLEINKHTAYSKGLAVMAITEDIGEIAGAVKKFIRDADGYAFVGSKYEDKIIVHLSSLLLQIELLALGRQTTISDLMEANLAKLKDRQERGVLGGSGDSR